MSVPLDFYLEVAKGNVSGHSVLHKYGKNPLINTIDGLVALWTLSGAYTGHNATEAEVITVTGGATDTIAGTGAQKILVEGLNSKWAPQSEIVDMNGAGGVDTVKKFIRQDRLRVVQAGSSGVNEGLITSFQKITVANVMCAIPIGYNRSMLTASTIPDRTNGFFIHWFATLAKKQAAFSNVRLKARAFGQVFEVIEEATMDSSGSSYLPRDYQLPKGDLPPKTDIFIEADTDTNAVGIAGSFDLILVNSR